MKEQTSWHYTLQCDVSSGVRLHALPCLWSAENKRAAEMKRANEARPGNIHQTEKLLSQWAGCASRCHVIGSVLQYTRPNVRDQSCQCTNFSLSWLHNKHIYFQYELTSCFAVFSIWSCRLMYLIAAVCFFVFFFEAGFILNFISTSSIIASRWYPQRSIPKSHKPFYIHTPCDWCCRRTSFAPDGYI